MRIFAAVILLLTISSNADINYQHSYIIKRSDSVRLTKEGLELVKKYEGLSLTPYICSGGKLTIGYGHTGELAKRDKITQGEAEEALREDLISFAAGVRKYIDAPTTDNEFNAMVSLAYNIGLGNFKKSDVLMFHNKGDKYNACKAFHDWRRANGKILKGLVLRRLEESRMYIK
jgi:lysozyme